MLQCSVVHSVSEAKSKVKLEPKLLQRPSLSQVGVQAQCSLHYSAQCAEFAAVEIMQSTVCRAKQKLICFSLDPMQTARCAMFTVGSSKASSG